MKHNELTEYIVTVYTDKTRIELVEKSTGNCVEGKWIPTSDFTPAYATGMGINPRDIVYIDGPTHDAGKRVAAMLNEGPW